MNTNEKLQKFVEQYQTMQDRLSEKLTSIYDFVDDLFKDNDPNVFNILKGLMEYFINSDSNSSELKTLLIISKPFKDNEIICETRISLLATYNAKNGK